MVVAEHQSLDTAQFSVLKAIFAEYFQRLGHDPFVPVWFSEPVADLIFVRISTVSLMQTKPADQPFFFAAKRPIVCDTLYGFQFGCFFDPVAGMFFRVGKRDFKS